MTISGVIDLRLDRRGLTGEAAGVTVRRVVGAAADGIGGGRRIVGEVGGTVGRRDGAVVGGAVRDAALGHGS